MKKLGGYRFWLMTDDGSALIGGVGKGGLDVVGHDGWIDHIPCLCCGGYDSKEGWGMFATLRKMIKTGEIRRVVLYGDARYLDHPMICLDSSESKWKSIKCEVVVASDETLAPFGFKLKS